MKNGTSFAAASSKTRCARFIRSFGLLFGLRAFAVAKNTFWRSIATTPSFVVGSGLAGAGVSPLDPGPRPPFPSSFGPVPAPWLDPPHAATKRIETRTIQSERPMALRLAGDGPAKARRLRPQYGYELDRADPDHGTKSRDLPFDGPGRSG